MARTGINNAKMLLTKSFSVQGLRVGRKCMSSSASQANNWKNDNDVSTAADERAADRQRCWMPHRRTGIYFPEGQESVMDGIPNDAASLDCTFWLRSIDGVDDMTETGNGAP